MKQCIHIEVKPHKCQIQGPKTLNLVGGLCCVGFIYPVGVVAGIRSSKLLYD
jgi:hypothetical protein